MQRQTNGKIPRMLDPATRMKMAVFGANLSGGTTLTAAEGTIKVTWPETVEIAQTADRLGLDAMISVSRWKGFGGDLNQNDRSFETLSWAAGIGAVTTDIQVIATVHVPTIHPVRLAKEGVTIDHISGGRFGLNVVAGWLDKEVEMFGSPVGDHTERYEKSEEWLSIVKRLWSNEEEEFNFEGKYYKVPGAHSEPKPLQTPHPLLMSAGSSPTGRDFASRHCDFNFILVQDTENLAEKISDIKRNAMEQYGRELKIMTMVTIVCADTEKEARDYFNHYVFEKGDWETVRRILGTLDRNSQSGDYKNDKHAINYIAGYGAVPLVGTPEQVVKGLKDLSDAGIDGVTLAWVDYRAGLKVFEEKLLPLLRQAGLRQ